MWVYLGLLVLILFLYHKWSANHWRRCGVDGPVPLPLVGNLLEYILAKKHFGEVYQKVYKSYSSASYVGIYRLLNEPAILVRDLDFVKDVFVRKFNAYHDNSVMIDPKLDPLAMSNPFYAKGDRWKLLRSQLAPLFTSSKVKSLFPLVYDVCQKFEKYVARGPDNQYNAFEAKDLCSKFTIEVMASCGFGLNGEAFTNPNSEFAKFGEQIYSPTFWTFLQSVGGHFLPPVSKILRLPSIPKNIQRWLTIIAKEVIRRRETENGTRNDFLQLISDTKENDKILSENEVLGHCSTLLIEGFETSSTLMAYCLYELAINPDIQKAVHEELDRVLVKHNRTITYESLQEMNYLNSAMLETLRMHPVMSATVKLCTEDTELPPQYPGGRPVTIPAGTSIVVPVMAIQYDPELYPKPNTFNPERFNDENQGSRNKYSFLSFGEGPRICIGMRFGMMQSKAGLATILYKYNVRLSPKTQVPTKPTPATYLLNPESGLWMNFERRLRKL
ncbi:unnamed protein product [Hermetia illucens]|uniref:Cytochrome P450 n=1 Tax=Hermetia illucens TaxID=343691 RepID=A0A7R8YPS1_HERIL|nr:probable cytochrome P450 308a1 [Hermetia illucens]CAD7077682.1 unnamed protein product [Hermetia illucens]